MQTIDTSGEPGHDGSRGRDGRDGKMGRELKKGGRGAGGNGTRGTAGGNGTNGKNGRNVKVVLRFDGHRALCSGTGGQLDIGNGLKVDGSGGRGGDGGDGGRGGSGGYGNPSGQRGADGAGGDGGDGGDGANVSISTDDSHLFGLVLLVDVSGGRGGYGGSGSPSGGAGRSGSDGVVQLLHKRGTFVEEDERFGVEITDLAHTCDETLLNGNLTRGSRFHVNGVEIENKSAISIAGPFEVFLHAQGPLTIGAGCLRFTDDRLEAFAQAGARGDIPCQVAAKCDIGFFAVGANATSTRGQVRIILNCRAPGLGAAGGLPSTRGQVRIILNLSPEPSTFRVPVNHRLDRAGIEATTSPDGHGHVQSLATRLDQFSPDRQMAEYTAMLVGPLAQRQARLSAERVEELATIVEGHLVSRTDFSSALRRVLAKSVEEPQADVEVLACIDFFGSLSSETQHKAMDATYFTASSDGVFDEQEKALIIRLAEGFGLGRVWLSEHIPDALTAGATRVRARRRNLAAGLAVPFVGLGIAMLLSALAWCIWPTEVADFLTGDHVRIRAGQSAIAGTAFLLALWLMGSLAFRKACRSCRSVCLAPVAQSLETPMLGATDAFRCLDCGGRGNTSQGGERELYHSQRSMGPAPGWLVAVPALAALGAAAVVRQAVPVLAEPLDLGWWALLCAVLWLVTPLQGVHRLSNAAIPAAVWVVAALVSVAALPGRELASPDSAVPVAVEQRSTQTIVERDWGPDAAPASGTGSHCGAPEANPVDRPADWTSYRCASRIEAGSVWSHCLGQANYTTDRARGCPGRQRCCPPGN